MKEVKAEIRKVHWKIDMFTSESVTRCHNESMVSAKLEVIGTMYLLAKEKHMISYISSMRIRNKTELTVLKRLTTICQRK